MENKKETFEYTYSAREQAEIERIKKKYIPKQESETKLEQLKRLDASVTKPGTITGLTIGIVGSLVFGGGMSCCLVAGDSLLVAGIVLGIFGIIMMSMAYPLYKKITEKEKERIAPMILALTEELEL